MRIRSRWGTPMTIHENAEVNSEISDDERSDDDQFDHQHMIYERNTNTYKPVNFGASSDTATDNPNNSNASSPNDHNPSRQGGTMNAGGVKKSMFNILNRKKNHDTVVPLQSTEEEDEDDDFEEQQYMNSYNNTNPHRRGSATKKMYKQQQQNQRHNKQNYQEDMEFAEHNHSSNAGPQKGGGRRGSFNNPPQGRRTNDNRHNSKSAAASGGGKHGSRAQSVEPDKTYDQSMPTNSRHGNNNKGDYVSMNGQSNHSGTGSMSNSNANNSALMKYQTQQTVTETPLFHAIEDREWRSAIVRVRHSPIEASMWICSNSKSQHDIMNGKVLPIHCACVHQAPAVVMRELLKAFPSGIKARDSGGNLPLHYAVRFGTEVDVLEILLSAYPESIEAMDCDGLTPIVIAVNCPYPNKDRVVNSLSRGVAYYATSSMADPTMIPQVSTTPELDEERMQMEEQMRNSAYFSPPSNHRPTSTQLNPGEPSDTEPFYQELDDPVWNKFGLSIIIIGASNDIVRRKIFPSLFHIFKHQLLPHDTVIYTLGKTDFRTTQAFREKIKSFFQLSSPSPILDKFLSKIHYQQISSYDDITSYNKIGERIYIHEEKYAHKVSHNRLFFIAVPSHLLNDVASAIVNSGSSTSTTSSNTHGNNHNFSLLARKGWNRFVVEHSLGISFDHTKSIMHDLHKYIPEQILFRIDHYLGKEQIRNMLYLRFSNVFFENLWNRNHIQCVIISYKEKFSQKKDNKESKSQYTDGYGIIKEIIQHHLMQMLTLVAMDAPVKLDGPEANEEIVNAKTSILRSIPSITKEDCFLGQYEGYEPLPNGMNHNAMSSNLMNKGTGTVGGTSSTFALPSDAKTSKVLEEKNAPTYALLRCFIRNSRWEGVPFILQAATGVEEDVEEIKIQFKNLPNAEFLMDNTSLPIPRNELIFRNNFGSTSNPKGKNSSESIVMKTNIKSPGDGIVSNNKVQSKYYPDQKLQQQHIHNSFMLQQMETEVQSVTSFSTKATTNTTTALEKNNEEENKQQSFDPDSYTRSVLDVLRGKRATFLQEEEIMQTWQIFLPLYHKLYYDLATEEDIEEDEVENVLNSIRLFRYQFGSSGPEGANEWLKKKSGYLFFNGKTAQTITKTTATVLEEPAPVSPPNNEPEESQKKEVEEEDVQPPPSEQEPQRQAQPVIEIQNIPKSHRNNPTSGTITTSGPCDIGIFGLTTFGQNLVLTMASHGYKICIGSSKQSRLDSTVRRARELQFDTSADKTIYCSRSADEFIRNLSKPRKVILIGISSKPIDSTIQALMKLLEPGDVIIDTGIEWYSNCLKRFRDVESKGLLYMNIQIFGDASSTDDDNFNEDQHVQDEQQTYQEGLACFMLSGPKEAYELVEDLFAACAKKYNDMPCVGYIGSIGSVNYTKMVQTGIEYGFMQLLSEAYDIMKNMLGMDNEEMSMIFQKWNSGADEFSLKSYLIHITSIILTKRDSYTAKNGGEEFVVDNILDKVSMKGVGKFIVQEASEQNQELSTVGASLDARFVCAKKEDREVASQVLNGPTIPSLKHSGLKLKSIKNALYASLVILYSQGFALLSTASDTKGFDLDLPMIAGLWNVGSTIRSNLLSKMQHPLITVVVDENLDTATTATAPNNLMLHPTFADILNDFSVSLREVIVKCVENGIACPAFSASLTYFDSLRRNRLPANLIQAQRNFIGGHSFERTDRAGVYRCAWTEGHKSGKVKKTKKIDK